VEHEAERLRAECETAVLAQQLATVQQDDMEMAERTDPDDSDFKDGNGEGDDNEVCVSADEVDSDGGTDASQVQLSTFSKCGAEDELEGDKERLRLRKRVHTDTVTMTPKSKAKGKA